MGNRLPGPQELNSVHTGQRSGVLEWPAGPQQAGSECLPTCLSPGLSQGICVCLPSARERVSFSRGLLFWCLRVCPFGVFSLHPVRVSSSSFFQVTGNTKYPEGSYEPPALAPLLAPPPRLPVPPTSSRRETAAHRGAPRRGLGKAVGQSDPAPDTNADVRPWRPCLSSAS